MERQDGNGSYALIDGIYRKEYTSVYTYIYYRVNSHETARDLAQDVFLRLLDYNSMLCRETILSFIYRIASNIVTDHLRMFYRRREHDAYIYDRERGATAEAESTVMAADIEAVERRRCDLMPVKRRMVYMLSRFGGKSVTEISKELNISVRTVENHLLIGRKDIRNYIRQCI